MFGAISAQNDFFPVLDLESKFRYRIDLILKAQSFGRIFVRNFFQSKFFNKLSPNAFKILHFVGWFDEFLNSKIFFLNDRILNLKG